MRKAGGASAGLGEDAGTREKLLLPDPHRIILTCNPSDYAGLGARQVTLSAPTLTVGSFAGHPPTESGADNSTDLPTEPEPDTPQLRKPAASEEQGQQFLEELTAKGTNGAKRKS